MVSEGALAFDGEHALAQSHELARTGDKDGFAALTSARGHRLAPGAIVAVVGVGREPGARVVTENGARWWVDVDRLSP